MGMTTPHRVPKTTTAFYVQAGISFGVALLGLITAELYLPLAGWVRAFLALATLYLVTSTFTLAKCVRDAHESDSVIGRLDQVRLERLLAEFDPYQVQPVHPVQPTHPVQPIHPMPPAPTP